MATVTRSPILIHRRKNNTPYRRAFVHDFDDGLTVNWVNDYAGGVTINGVKKIEGHNSGPIKKTEFSDAVDFKAGVDYHSQIRIIATAVFYTRLYMDPDHNLVIENKPMLGMPSKQTIFKTPVHFERPVKLSGVLQPEIREWRTHIGLSMWCLDVEAERRSIPDPASPPDSGRPAVTSGRAVIGMDGALCRADREAGNMDRGDCGTGMYCHCNTMPG